ncbi:MAG: ParA family protein [Chloroflexi bacterium]|nr:ParA family protein [Chloroflexota bacterium]
MRVIAIANHKGGVGKTASTHALGTALGELGQRVLLVDVDPQSSLTAACGVDTAANESLAEVLGGVAPGQLSLPDVLLDVGDGLPIHLVPADIALAPNELGMVQRYGRESLLQSALAAVSRTYDVCLIDCPPSLGLLTVNALRAATAVIIPTQPQISDLRGLKLFLDTIVQIRQEINPRLEILGILVTFLDSRLIHHQDALATMRGQGLPVFEVRIGRSVRVAEAAAAGESIVIYDPSNPQAENYRQLAKEIEKWLKSGQR